MFSKRFFNIAAVMLICLCSLKVQAGKESVSFYQKISTITNNHFFLQENKYLNAAYIYSGTAKNAYIKSSFAKISLKIFDQTPFISVPNQDVYFNITCFDVAGNMIGGTSQIRKLNVSNLLSGHNLEDKKDLDMFIVDGAHRVELQVVNNVHAPLTPLDLSFFPANIAFEIEIETERYYQFNALTAALNSSQVGHNPVLNNTSLLPEELEVYWDAIPGVEEYDLEWAFVDDYDVTSGAFQTGSAINSKIITFKGNSTRVSTPGNFYRIPIVFEHGYIVYRVRGVGRSLNNTDIVLEGSWNLLDGQPLSYYSANSSCVYHNTGNVHENDAKNWQYNATFAEEGKRKHTVTYADGTLRSRQIITQNNTDKTVILGQTIYDYQGRKAIETMPVPDPSGQNKFQYHSQFTQNAANVAYTKEDFDKDYVNACNPVTPALGKLSGAGKYYSPNNLLSSPSRPYTPDAFGYAFMQTEYKADNTGRVKAQGGVGDNHYIGSGHETKYLYGSPDQEEIDALFGTEVGSYVHYQKNVVIDANGQASISYVDLKGKTIATALAGLKPTAVTSIIAPAPSVFDAAYINDVSGNGSINGNSTKDNALVFEKKIVIEGSTNYTINYDVVPEEFSAACISPSGVCYDCVYDLKISLKNECGEELLTTATNITGYFTNPSGRNALVGDVGGGTSFVGFIDDGCSNSSSTNKYTSAPITLATPLAPGEYMLTKTLKVNNDAMEFYLSKYLQSNCVKHLSDFETAATDAMDVSGCNIPCLDCLERTSLCEASYQALLSDVSMGGQYAEYTVANGIVTATGALSLLNENNALPKVPGDMTNVYPGYKPYWKFPILNGLTRNYEYANGMVAYVPVNPNDPIYTGMPLGTIVQLILDPASGYLKLGNGNIYGVLVKDLKDLSAFRTAWNANFAKFLVEYHPEFSYYQFCITQSGKSEHYFPEKIVANPPSVDPDHNYTNIGTYKTNFEDQWKGNNSFKTKSIVMNPTLITTSIQTNPGVATLSSEEFDDQLNTFVTSINDLSDATIGFCSSCATDILSTAGVNGTHDLINIDPYFDATTNPLIVNRVFGTKTQEIFNYYKTKLLNTMQFPTVTIASGLTVSNVKQAFMLSIAEPECNFQNVFYPTTATMPPTCGVNITTDDIWNRYKDFYLSNKRQILFEMADEFAKLTEYGTLFNNVPFGNQNYIYKQSNTSATPNSAPTSYFNQLTAGNYPGSYSLPANYRYIKGYNGCIGNPDFDPFASDFIRQGSNPRLSNLNTTPGPNYIYPSHFSQVLGFQSDFYDTRAYGIISSMFAPSFPWNIGFTLQPSEGWGFYDRGQTCNADLKDNFLKKVKRFQSGLGYMQEEYNTSATSAADIVAAIGSQVSYQNQQVMGICPLANDLTGLLNNLFQGIPTGDATHPSYNATFNSPLWIFPAFTKLLYDNIIDDAGTCSSSYVFLQTKPHPGTPSNVLSLDLYGSFSNFGYGVGTSYSAVSSVSSCVKCTSGNLVTLTIPTGRPYTFSDIVSVNKMTNVNGSSFSLMITYQLLVGPNIVTYDDVITGTTCLPLTGCTSDPPPVLCDATPVGTDLVKLLSALGNTYNNGSSASASYYTDLFNTTGVVLNPTGPSPINYSSSFTSNILNQLGAASSTYNWQWKQVTAGNFRIFSASANVMDITIYSGATGLSLTSGNSYVFSNLRKVSGQSLIDVKMTNLSTYVSTTGTYVITAKLNPANTDVPLFDCHIPMDPLCNKAENRTYEELRYFLDDILPAYGSGGGGYSYNITYVSSFTNFLKSQLPGGINGKYFLSRPDDGGVPGTWNYKIAQLNPDYLEAQCLTSDSWSYSEDTPKCLEVVCEIHVKDMSPAALTTPVVWSTLLGNLMPGSISGSKNDHTLCGSVLYPDGLLDQREIEITTCWKVEKCCSSSGVDGVVASPPSLNCTTEYNDFVSDLNALSSSSSNVVTNSSASNASSTMPYNVTDSYIPQADFCNRSYYGMYVNYVNYFTAVETKLNTLNVLLPASKQYVDPLADPSSKFYYSLGNFASANNLGRLIEYFNYLTAFTLPVNIAPYNPDSLQSYSEYITSHNPGCNSDCSTALDIVPTEMEPIAWNDDCIEELGALAGSNGLIQYQQYVNQISSEFRNAYIAKCLKAKENLSTKYNSNRYHYTLYYYDQAGNLIKTVPPNGVVPFTAPADFAQVVSYRNQNAGTGTPVIKVPSHAFSTLYKYNSLNQLTGQTIPDHDYVESDFYYDKLGRLVISQNPKQKNVAIPGNSFWRSFSYTQYDELGRIKEVGEVNTVPSAIGGLITSGTNQMANDPAFSALLFVSSKQQITKTSYDYASMASANFQSDFMRGRVAKTSLDVNGDGIVENASHFSYDVHGNVKSLINQYNYNAFENIGNKRIDYDYDLISGKVNSVAYQKGMPDQYYHNYYYDADNRIIETQTSKDGYIWNKDAKYYYYLHGPLSRTELGDRKVQGQDYYYTIHGWIKGVNGEAFIRKSDPGRDGYIETGTGDSYAYTGITPKLHASVGLDAFAYSLGYYEPTVVSGITTANKDYVAIRNNGVGDYDATLDPFAAPGKLRLLAGYRASLYNGNIKHMGTSLVATPLNKSNYYQRADPLLQTFKYDQLNRIVASEGSFNYTAYGDAGMNVFSSNGTIGVATNVWNLLYPFRSVSGYTYDPNGNISHLTRKNLVNGSSASVSMDDMSYSYQSNAATARMYAGGSYNTNRLDNVTDPISLGNGDFSSGQNPGNYDYDDIGNLTKDVSEHIGEIEWNVYGKISQIKFLSNTKSDLEFRYDAKGDRIMKIVKPRVSNVLTETNGWIYTIYVRDAQGNVMNVYETTYTNPEAEHYVKETKLIESHLYGSSRLGVHDRQPENISETLDIFCGFGTFTTAYENIGLLTYGAPVAALSSFPFASRELGNKTYEMSNHLGNVQTTISDRKIAVDAGTPNADNVTYTGTYDGITDYYIADITSATDYYPFGSPISSRKWQATSSYRYGFNGKEKDDEIAGNENSLDYGARMYDSRLGRWLSLDPLAAKYPNVSPYTFVLNNPILFKDPDGRDVLPTTLFNSSGFSAALEILTDENSTFKSLISKFENNKKFNLRLDINNSRVPQGSEAMTSGTFRWETINGKKTIVGAETRIDFRTDADKKVNALGRATLVIHEVIHAYAVSNGKVSKTGTDSDHAVWDQYFSLMKQAVTEYGKDHGYKFSEQDIVELSIFNAGQGAHIYDNYVKNMAKLNDTTEQEERDALNSRMTKLVGVDGSNVSAPTEENSDPEAPPSKTPSFTKPK